MERIQVSVFMLYIFALSGGWLCDVRRPDISLEVYMAKFHKDRPINLPVLPDWILPIQVGKALTDIRVARLTDDTGDNISAKNVDYSEATALYWIVEEHRRDRTISGCSITAGRWQWEKKRWNVYSSMTCC